MMKKAFPWHYVLVYYEGMKSGQACNLTIFLSSFFACRINDYIINAHTIRECNFATGTMILGKGFAQALVHTVHSTRAFGSCTINYVCPCAWLKPFPKISVHMAKLHSLIVLLAFIMSHGEIRHFTRIQCPAIRIQNFYSCH